MVTYNVGKRSSKSQIIFDRISDQPLPGGGASSLDSTKRRELSIEALAGTRPISHLAADHGISRKFVYQQAAKASETLDDLFSPHIKDDKVLFYLPVTKQWIRQLVLSLILICHSSFRGVKELCQSVLDMDGPSEGTVHNIVRHAIATAETINDSEDLSAVTVGAHDEIFQAHKPVLTGVDLQSTYCYLLTEADHRDATTWGVHLLDLTQRHGLKPQRTIADGGTGLRAGQEDAWGKDVPCNGDVFHAERDVGTLAYYLENRAVGCTAAREKIERKMHRHKKKGQGRKLSKRLAVARKQEAQTTELAEDVRAMADWMKNDILSLAGPDLATRRELFDFIVAELEKRESHCAHRIRPVRRMLQGHRDNLLAFAGVLDERFEQVARSQKIPVKFVHDVCQLDGVSRNLPAYWQQENALRKKLRGTFHTVQSAVREIMAETPRASSMVENLNSRLRNYFFLRRHIGNGYLDLLRFFLNHRCYVRSDRPERVGKSPAELLRGRKHPHWLEMLGFKRFQRN